MIFLSSILAGRCLANFFIPLRTYRRYFNESYYQVLKVSPTSSSKEIREAFLLLSKQNHPDKHLNDPSMHEKFVKINEAYSTLINPSSRRAYDLTLYNERKLNPPYGKPYQQTYTQRKSSTYEAYQSTKSSPNSNYGFYRDPFSWEHHTKSGPNFASGLRGLKRFSNTVIVFILLSITLVGAIIQLLIIRHNFLLNQEKILERSHHYSLIHKLAKEKAQLYGNAHQIEILKRKLNNSNKDESIDDNSGNVTVTVSDEDVTNYIKGKSQTIDGSTESKSRTGKVGGCSIHRTQAQCALHHKLNNDNIKIHDTSSDSCKKCKKCGHKIH